MSALISDDAGELPAAFRPMHDYLARTVPPETAAALVHNDFRLGNLLLAPARPGRLGAVLDWELTAVGDPLLDLGYLLASIPVRGTEFTPVQEMGTAFLEPGYPTRSDIVERYSKAMSPALGNLEWYIAFAQWKLAVLYEYSRGRLLAGVGDEYYRDPGKVTAFLEAAEAEATS
jgi:aminoglycoside phosphotransferase (APT) family kinase protein